MAAKFFVIGGGGWRAGFFMRAAQQMPQRFRCSGAIVRDAAKAKAFTETWGAPAYSSIDELFTAQGKPTFAVVSVSRTTVVDVLSELARRRVPTLCETPPAPDVASLERVNALTSAGGRIQVAEQYLFHPLHEARLAIVRSGMLGKISQAQVSINHSYHNISLIRHYLGITNEPVKITARRFVSPIIQGPGRAGPPSEEKIIENTQTLAWFDYGTRLGVFDFAGDQHRSYVRSNRILVRGDRGEINENTVRHLADFRTPLSFELTRSDAGQNGNMEGYHHRGILGGDRWWYTNPFGEARLYDDELAVAMCMDKMIAYADGGPDFYSLAEGSYDTYLSLMLDQAASSGAVVNAEPPVWAKWA